MTRLFRLRCCKFLILILAVAGFIPQTGFGQGQSVTALELRDAIRSATSDREKNLENVRSFFADPKVVQALASARLDNGRVQKAVSALSTDEIAKLAARTTQIQKDFAAGALSNQELTYIVIALGAAVIVLVLVV